MHTTTEDLPVARELLRTIEDHARFLISPRSRLRRQFAAAGLARCCALLDSMCLIAEGGRTDTFGILLRGLFEHWALALYVLGKGKDPDDLECLVDVAADNAKATRALIDRLKLDQLKDGITERLAILAEHDIFPKAINWEQLAREVEAIYADPGQPWIAVNAYNYIYRVESTYGGAHANLGSFENYLEYDDNEERDAVIFRPETPFPNQLRLGALLTVGLARRVFKEFGIVVKPSLDDFEGRFSGVAEGAASQP